MTDELIPTEPEMATCHVEDVKSGYILHHPEHGVSRVLQDAWVSWVDADPDGPPNTVGLHVLPVSGVAVWLDYELGSTVEVEA